MRLAVNEGFECGHFSNRVELELDKPEYLVEFTGTRYCHRCNDFINIKRVNIFVIEREIPEIT